MVSLCFVCASYASSASVCVRLLCLSLAVSASCAPPMPQSSPALFSYVSVQSSSLLLRLSQSGSLLLCLSLALLYYASVWLSAFRFPLLYVSSPLSANAVRALCSDVAGHGYVALTGERAGREEREEGGSEGGRERCLVACATCVWCTNLSCVVMSFVCWCHALACTGMSSIRRSTRIRRYECARATPESFLAPHE